MTHAILHFLQWMQGRGWEGMLGLVLVYAAACILFLPGSLLTLGAGAVYGLWTGMALISAGSLLGSTLSFLAGRYLFRRPLQKRLAKNEKFQKIDEAVSREGGKIVFLSRLSPIFPFSLLNYGLGLTRISLGRFMAASWLGTLPLIAVYVYGGMVAGSLAALGTGRGKPPGLWALQIGGLVATVALCVFVTRLAGKALKTKISS
jgi:uncharacterized membrane protein YdjX (TVP38/TMEM64 family)